MVAVLRCIIVAIASVGAPVLGWSQTAAGTPVAAVSPSSLTFTALEVGRGTPSQSVTVSNSGDGQLRVTGVTLAGAAASDFSVFNGCRLALSKNQRCVIAVGFKPSAAGTREAALSIATSDKALSVKLSGSVSSTAPK
ncbi:MAG: choice-of-anchor D domain-containing protein, partial [Gammaproteobacteria bacterium]